MANFKEIHDAATEAMKNREFRDHIRGLLFEFDKQHCSCDDHQGTNLRCQVHGSQSHEAVAAERDGLKTLCVDFARAVGEALIRRSTAQRQGNDHG